MTRTGIHYTDVKHAAVKLLSQGTAPSVQKIREALGTGSHTTIAAHLKVWREEHSANEVYHLPGGMPEELVAAFERVWQTAVEQANQQLSALREEVKEREEKWQREKDGLEKTLGEVQARLEESQRQGEEKIQQTQALQTELAVLQERLVTQADALIEVKDQYEARLKRVFDEKDQALAQVDRLESEILQGQRQLAEQVEKQQATLTHERALQAQSEERWLKLIDQARTEAAATRKQYEGKLSKQSAQIETLQTALANAQNKEVMQAAALSQANIMMAKLKKQCQQLQVQYREAIRINTAIKRKRERQTEKARQKQEELSA